MVMVRPVMMLVVAMTMIMMMVMMVLAVVSQVKSCTKDLGPPLPNLALQALT